ncbi:MAG: NfeD family protein, partial [Bdellovibrionales bacterium]
MVEFLENLEFWHWWIAAAVFLILEMFAPGVVFIWMGASAAIVGAALFAVPDMVWELQFAIWGVLAVASAVIGRNYVRKNP